MKITYLPTNVTFGQLNSGDPFMCGKAIYIRIRGSEKYNAVCLKHGDLTYISELVQVKPVEAEVVIK